MPIPPVSSSNRNYARPGLVDRGGVIIPRRNFKPELILGHGYGWFLNGQSGFLDNLTLSNTQRRLYLEYITVNGVTSNPNNIVHTYTNSLTYRNDGYGLNISTYVDVLNSIMSTYGLKSRFITAVSGNPTPALGDFGGIFYTDENFKLRFYDTVYDPILPLETYGFTFDFQCVYGRAYDKFTGFYDPINPPTPYSDNLDPNNAASRWQYVKTWYFTP